MGLKRWGWAMVEFCLAWMLGLGMALTGGVAAQAQGGPGIATTAIADTVYHGNGTPATGTVLVSWPAFTTAGGASVPAGTSAVAIAASGALSVALVPNAGSTPMGSYYTAVYHLDDGSVTREYWVIPVSATAVKLSGIRSSVLPTSVAMQTVSKSYVDTAIAVALTGHSLDSSPYVVKAGDTMAGPLVLAADPTTPLQASDKRYVDLQVTALAGGSGQKVSLGPQATQTVTQPVGTQLAVNNLNGVEQASQYVSSLGSGAGNNGIANAVAGPDCAAGCEVKAEQTYGVNLVVPLAERVYPTTWNNETHVDDHRGGGLYESFLNPTNVEEPGQNAGLTLNLVSTQPVQAVVAATGSQNTFSTGLVINGKGLAGGSNVYPKLLQGTVPYFKTTFSTLNMTGTNNTLGQHVLVPEFQNCYGVGDCLMGSMFLTASGGFRDDADEGAHPFDLQIAEDSRVFKGSCAGGCTAGASVLQVASTSGAGTQGEGRYLLNTTPSKVITTGSLINGAGGGGRQPGATFAGTNFAVSTLLETAQTIPTQNNSIAPGTVSVSIATAGAPPGFASSTATLPATSGVACVTDAAVADGRPLNFETAAYTVIDAGHLQLTLNRPHATGATIAVGGLCGYGLEQTVDTMNGIRQVFPVLASTSGTTLLYAGGQTSIVGVQGLQSAFANMSFTVASIARANNVVTVAIAGNLPVDVNGLTFAVQGVADASYNGSFAVTTTSLNTLTYVENGANSTSAGGTLALLTGSYALYPMAEVLNVYNQTTKAVDGQMTLAANTVAWAQGDTVEQPHYFQEAVAADVEAVTQYTPRPARNQSAGIFYQGNNGPGLNGWQINNAVPSSAYFGNGGTHTAPSSGMGILGIWQHSMEMQAGEDAAIKVHCNSHGCDKWNSGYDLFQMDTSAGVDRMSYAPATSTLNFSLRGASFQFNPLGLTLGTMNAATVNAGAIHATTITGSLAGTVTPGSLPVYVGSGSGHQVGAVPDAGAVAGTTRFLREDGTWATAGASTLVTSLSGYTTQGPGSFPKRASLLGEYLLSEGTGTIAHDTSGQGNDGTLGGTNAGPAWEGAADLNFSAAGQYVQLPVALNGAKAWQFAIYNPPYGNGVAPQPPGYGSPGQFPSYPSILCGTDANHLCLLANSTTASKQFRFDAYSTDQTESAEVMTAGWHIFTLLCGSNVAGVVQKTHYLYDGAEVGSYLKQGDAGTCPNPTTGNYQIGGSSVYGGQSWFLGKVAAAWAWSATLSVADGAAAAKSALGYMQAKGVATDYRKITNATPQVIAGFDSRTSGTGVTPGTAWPATMTLTDATYARVNLAVPGLQLIDACAAFDMMYGSYYTALGAPTISVFWGGANDIDQLNQPVRLIANSLRCVVLKAKAAGSRVVVATEISSLSNAGTTGDTGKNALDAIIRAEAYGWGADNVADLATDPHLGADGASSNTTCFPDNLHPGPGCEPYVTAIMQNAVNELIGSTETTRNKAAAATYQEVAGDRFLDLTGTAAQTVTLPSCIGYSLPRQVLNLGTAGATFATTAGQLLQGSAGLAAGARATFVPVPGALATGGCSWERTQ